MPCSRHLVPTSLLLWLDKLGVYCSLWENSLDTFYLVHNGEMWRDFSYGLPKTHVNKIIQKGMVPTLYFIML